MVLDTGLTGVRLGVVHHVHLNVPQVRLSQGRLKKYNNRLTSNNNRQHLTLHLSNVIDLVNNYIRVVLGGVEVHLLHQLGLAVPDSEGSEVPVGVDVDFGQGILRDPAAALRR